MDSRFNDNRGNIYNNMIIIIAFSKRERANLKVSYQKNKAKQSQEP